MNRSRTVALAAVGILALVGAACGDDAPTTSASDGDVRTVQIDMSDNVFEPDTVDVTRGETVRFVFTNTGAIAHEAFVGDAAAQDDHEMSMGNSDSAMDHGHGDDESDGITVDPGDTGELTHTFDGSGTLQIGCHEPGHYASGMKLSIDVT